MSAEAVLNKVRSAIEAKRSIRIAGAATWMGAGRPVQSAETISLASDSGVVDYVPDDLTMTVRAGTTLSEIASATRANGQWLPLDPFGGMNGTIGATIATASSGPLAHSAGFARDFILGLELVTGKGDVVRSGGRVVKNVAGFDLMRLNCGAWGSLGVITQASVRLYAQPKVDRTFALVVPNGMKATGSFLELLRTAPLAALSMEAIHPSVSSKLGLSPEYFVLVRLGGNAKLVDAQLATLSGIGKAVETDSRIWEKMTEADFSSCETVLRLTGLPTSIASLWQTAHALLDSSQSGFLHSTFSRGTVRVGLTGLDAGARLPVSSPAQRVTYETLPRDQWRAISPTVVGDRLSQSVKRAFDPHSLLNPGILG